MERRQFIIRSGRLFLLAGFSAVGIVTLLKRKDIPEVCRLNEFCQNCKELKHCNLPQAAELKYKK